MAAEIRLRNKETGKFQKFFAVDAREVLAQKDCAWEIPSEGAVVDQPDLDAREEKPSVEAVEAQQSKFSRGGDQTKTAGKAEPSNFS